MADIKKVKKGLEYCSAGKMCADLCPYDDGGVEFEYCTSALAKDALELLKEQEADIIAMSRFLESHGWDSDSICGKLS